MIKKYALIIFSLIPLSLYGKCDTLGIEQADPQVLYDTIIKKHFEVLKQSVGTVQFKRQLKEFYDYIQCVYDTLRLKSGGAALNTLSQIAAAAGYVKENAENNNFRNVSIDAWRYREAYLHKSYLEYIYKIDKDIKEVPVGWQKSIPAKASSIFPDYERFFKNYERTKEHYIKYNNVSSFPSDRLFQFLKNQSFMFNSPVKNEKTKFTQFADVLEKLIYRLQEDKKKTWFSKGTIQKYIDLSQEILAGIFAEYPFITAKVDQKVHMSKNKLYLAIVAGAVSVYNIMIYVDKSINRK